MTTCDDVLGRIDEYHDRELPAAEAARIREHLSACAACAAELAALERLDGALRQVPAAGAPAWDRYLADVKRRTSARPRPAFGLVPALLAVAAAAIFGLVSWMATRPATPTGPALAERVGSLVDAWSSGDAAARARAERELTALGPEGVGALVTAALGDGRPARQAAAARILAASPDPKVRKLLVDRSAELAREDDREWSLSEIGVDSSDAEMVAPALDLARHPSTWAAALDLLRKMDRGGLGAAHKEIVRRMRGLLASDLPPERELGFRLAAELDMLEEDVVEFLDVPSLRDQALDFLKRRTGKDFGTDKEAWNRHFSGRKM